MTRVWYQLEDTTVAKVELTDDADVDDLKAVIKNKWQNRLKHIDAGALNVLAAGANPNNTNTAAMAKPLPLPLLTWHTNPHLTTGERPLIVVVLQQQQQQQPNGTNPIQWQEVPPLVTQHPSFRRGRYKFNNLAMTSRISLDSMWLLGDAVSTSYLGT